MNLIGIASLVFVVGIGAYVLLAAPALSPTSDGQGSSDPAGSTEPTLFGTMVTFSGTIVCLPKKGPGPHTMECAYGLEADHGNYYGLKNLFTEPGPWIFDVTDRIEVTGVLEEPEADTSYDIAGVIDVQNTRGL